MDKAVIQRLVDAVGQDVFTDAPECADAVRSVWQAAEAVKAMLAAETEVTVAFHSYPTSAATLLRSVLDDWRPSMENDEPINGGDAVEWLCGFYEKAEACLAMNVSQPPRVSQPISSTWPHAPNVSGHRRALIALSAQLMHVDQELSDASTAAPSPEALADFTIATFERITTLLQTLITTLQDEAIRKETRA
jgi:hypothetical protein